mmetsp:Transcript_82838/g.114440  ORF Transcript_82838/g.114440 Transcript_82838/m.114440 type:complete len:103 (+) Transcript_82838:503-811(+)
MFVGSCIGKRNIRYFIMFLALTAFHAFVTMIITFILLAKDNFDLNLYNPDEPYLCNLFNLGIFLYCIMIVLMLTVFLHYTNKLAMQNITSNENLRKTWNAAN